MIFFIIAGCSQKPSKKSGVKIILGRTIDSSGGAFVNVINPLSNTSIILKLDVNNSTVIEQGKYNIEAIVFSGPELKTGLIKCGLTEEVNLNLIESTVAINLNSDECLKSRYDNFFLKLKSTASSIWDLDQWNRSHWGP